MLDFFEISEERSKNGTIELSPGFEVIKSEDLMVRGGDFYAIWDEERKVWSTDPYVAIELIDKEIEKAVREKKTRTDDPVRGLYLRRTRNGQINKWTNYVKYQMPTNFHSLDGKLIFSNMTPEKGDYSTKHLNYPLEPGDTPSWDTLVSKLYSPEERHKIEWMIGSIVTGDSTRNQKFYVFYGAPGTGKSTILGIIQQLFKGYDTVFDAKTLGLSSNSFPLEAFRDNPLIAIQHDGDLSKIEDNTRLNSLVSHEPMTVNVKHKSAYVDRFNTTLLMGTNKPVKITDSRSGLLRRLIVISPSGEKLNKKEYDKACKHVEYELGAIAYKCKEVYLANPNAYDNYVPVDMMSASNDFFNYMEDSYFTFKKNDGTSLSSAWDIYKAFCENANAFQMSQRIFKEELKSYFREYYDRYTTEKGVRIRSYYKGFRVEKFEQPSVATPVVEAEELIEFKEQKSIFDEMCSDCPAQYANAEETPSKGWDYVKTTLCDIDTSKVHYVRVPQNHIVIDFDLTDENGNKSYEKNLRAASAWPKTYAELSKGGNGIHLHYIYNGDVTKLNSVVEDHVEIKVFSGKSSLRRRLSKCNDIPVMTISSALPLKREKKVVVDMVNVSDVEYQGYLTNCIKNCIAKKHHGATKPEVDFIFKILKDAYESGKPYDVTNLENAVTAFAAGSSHNADYCLKLVSQMKFKSDTEFESVDDPDAPDVIFDIEVFPNVNFLNWKRAGIDKQMVRMINPSPEEIENFLKFASIGYNCRRYDNHILHAMKMGYTPLQVYKLSHKIIDSQKGSRDAGLFGEAYNYSKTDVYDFASSGNKKSLKKLEIEMIDAANDPNSKLSPELREMIFKISHKELGIPWDEPVPEELWPTVAEYCDNDVLATEAAFHYLSADWLARQILADLANGSTNDTTNSLTTKIIFGKDRNPQNQFCYRNLGEPVDVLPTNVYEFLCEACPTMMAQRHGKKDSLLPYFEGYKFENGKSSYRGEEFGEGGYVYSEPGMYGNVALLDIASMHPHSVIAECLFGAKYTTRFRDIVEGRVSIKHEDWDMINDMMDGKLVPYIQKVKDGELTSKQLSDALKTAINSVYGLTSAKFDNAFRDIRNVDNIVAKRGELFMIDLKHEVQKRGFTVAHIKTDSIKIPDATPEIIQFVMEFGEKYGYTFEHEATYDRMCLVNKSTYIAKYKDGKHAGEWTATGDQFAVPYLFKKLFAKKEHTFSDYCETFAVSKGALYLDMNEGLPDVRSYERLRDARVKQKEEKKLTKMETALCDEYAYLSEEELEKLITQGHNYHFVGRVGQFTPVKPGTGGGILYRVNEGKNYAATGSTGYLWMESELARTKPDCVDTSYYENLVTEAIHDISLFGDYEWFVSDDPYIPPKFEIGEFMNKPVYEDGIPWD